MSKKMDQPKWLAYSEKIIAAIDSIFTEDSEFSINGKELLEGDNFTHFMHALANAAPTHIYNRLSGDSKNNLEFNHLANHLCFSFVKKEKEA